MAWSEHNFNYQEMKWLENFNYWDIRFASDFMVTQVWIYKLLATHRVVNISYFCICSILSVIQIFDSQASHLLGTENRHITMVSIVMVFSRFVCKIGWPFVHTFYTFEFHNESPEVLETEMEMLHADCFNITEGVEDCFIITEGVEGCHSDNLQHLPWW